jgi:hypothetical protein
MFDGPHSGACDFKFSQRGFGGFLYKAVQHDNSTANQRAEKHSGNTFSAFEPQFKQTIAESLGMRIAKIRPQCGHAPGQDHVTRRQRVGQLQYPFLNIFVAVCNPIVHAGNLTKMLIGSNAMISTCGSARPEPGTVLVSLVPRNELLLAEVMIDDQDIGFVKPGQHVRLKLAAYPFQRYGMVDGVVKAVIADSQTQGGVASTMTFKATIELKQQSLMVNESLLPLAVGMQLSAEIVDGKRTVLQYLLSPVQRVASEAGMER